MICLNFRMYVEVFIGAILMSVSVVNPARLRKFLGISELVRHDGPAQPLSSYKTDRVSSGDEFASSDDKR